MLLNRLLNKYRYLEKSLLEIVGFISESMMEKPHRFYKSELFYNGIIISIYGCFESFVDNVSLDYLDYVYNYSSECEAYVHENELIKQKLISIYQENLGYFLVSPKRYSMIDDADEAINQLVKSFYDAKVNNDYSNINKRLLTLHAGNMRSDIMFDLFSRLQIQNLCARVCDRPPFHSFINTELGFDDAKINPIKNNTKSEIFYLLNNLVDERNIIAHQGKSENKISPYNIKTKTIPFILLLAESICKIIGEDYLNKNVFVPEKHFENQSLIAIYNKRIVCHSNESYNITNNDYLIFKKPDDVFLITRIKEIQLDHVEIHSTGEGVNDFGFLVDEPIKDANYFIISVV